MQPARELLDDTQDQLRSMIDRIRLIVRGLRPAALRQGGLGPALLTLDSDGAGPGGPQIKVACGHLPERIPAAVETAAYLIAAEATENFRRHVGAGSCLVRVGPLNGVDGDPGLFLGIEDDGTGFDHQGVQAGLGLASMRQRARDLGAGFELESDSAGTRIRVRFPLPREDE